MINREGKNASAKKLYIGNHYTGRKIAGMEPHTGGFDFLDNLLEHGNQKYTCPLS